MRTLALLGALVALSFALLLAVPLDHELSYGFLRNTTATAGSIPITPADGLPYTRRNIRFDSHGTSCDAWLYTPLLPRAPGAGASASISSRFPVVIMAHGLGAQKDLGLHRYADAFARAGMAVLVFDYRTFGGSDGEPRHWASPSRHLADWRAALGFVKSGNLGPEYDIEKVALWGTSYAGGHVLVVAGEQPPGSLAAIVSMVPHLDGVKASRASVRRRGLPASLRLLAAGLHDRHRAATSDLLHAIATWLHPKPQSHPHPLYPHSGGGGRAEAALTSPVTATSTQPVNDRDASAGAGGDGGWVSVLQRRLREVLAPVLPPPHSWPRLPPAYVKSGGWRPVVLARFALETSSYSPIKSVPRITAPVLFISALRDQLCPPELVRRAAALLPVGAGSSNSNSSVGRGSGSGSGAELVELDCTHFDIYLGEHLVSVLEATVSFLTRQLLPQGGRAEAEAEAEVEVPRTSRIPAGASQLGAGGS
ncbi:hypothetical protein VOLCADRAFT_94145 [Volvox carteri f. nagariensis]|uniref:Serine aminopeptidase S33 domain-containing protein n=1 Tax=Volvox carteri f. nagariensis TaxID=3068 RepID=D8U496_VOLCA|nr:uncharacterized protein VOLCADRAFT_94145 [Volvox carteri f. nagariensis]EFJ45464.1 hypothetical protein VOLCADRAFT_94145 [Volvox carteri f. nagariensis]|eukprot:XP_002953491.1 hypothetical protein VOLCADRAFT_94145 [Volvox carteri f. nagariensis]